MSQEDQSIIIICSLFCTTSVFFFPREVIEKMLQRKARMEAALTRIKVTQVMRSWAWNDVLFSPIIS